MPLDFCLLPLFLRVAYTSQASKKAFDPSPIKVLFASTGPVKQLERKNGCPMSGVKFDTEIGLER